MLKDRYFYPLAGAFIAAMIAFALSFGNREDLSDFEIWSDGYTMEGEELARLTVQPGTLAEYTAAAGGEPAFARLSSNAARDALPSGPGVFAPLGPDYERAFSGRRLRLTITVRPSRINPLSEFDMGYFTAGAGDSGWKRRELEDGWQDYAMEFQPGLRTSAPDIDYFSIWPGTTAEPLGLDVRRMRIDVLDAPRD